MAPCTPWCRAASRDRSSNVRIWPRSARTPRCVISPRQGAQHGEERSSRAGRVPCVEIQLSTLPGLKVRARCVCEAPSEEWSASSTLD